METSRKQYYEWRSKLLEPHLQSLSETYGHFEADESAIDHLRQKFEMLDQSLSTQILELETSVQTHQDDLQAEQSRIEKQELYLLNQKEIVSLELQELERKLVELENLEKEADKSIEELESKQNNLATSIRKAEEVCKDLVDFDPEDLASFRQDYCLLVLTHLWRPISLNLAQQVWRYDDIIEISFNSQGDLYEINASPVSLKKEPFSLVKGGLSTSHAVCERIGLGRLKCLLKRYEKRCGLVSFEGKQKVFQDIACIWQNCLALDRDIQKAQKICPIVFKDENTHLNLEAFIVTSSFFSSEKKTRFSVDFKLNFDKGWLLYPYGKLQSTMDVEYGDVEYFYLM